MQIIIFLNNFWHFFLSILNTFFGIFEPVQASGRMVGADTIPRPTQSYNHKDLRQYSIKYRVQNEVAAQMNSWRARRHIEMRGRILKRKKKLVSYLVGSGLRPHTQCQRLKSRLD